jgi:hypothetical protein
MTTIPNPQPQPTDGNPEAPASSPTQLIGKPVAGTWRLRQSSQGSHLELFRFGGSWTAPSPDVKIHLTPAHVVLVDRGELFVKENP